MDTLENIQAKLERAAPGAVVELCPNDTPAAQRSLLLDADHALEAARFLKEDPELRFDYASNATGVDYLDRTVKEKTVTREMVDGEEREVERATERAIPGFLEVVYHLYSVEKKHGPLILRLRTRDRGDGATLPSLTPVWRGLEFQEREIYDLYGIRFEGHPDLRRILMWDEFEDHPMRKDYVEPNDYEYEPTAHGDVLKKAQAQAKKEAGS